MGIGLTVRTIISFGLLMLLLTINEEGPKHMNEVCSMGVWHVTMAL